MTGTSMARWPAVALLAVLVLLGGCETRSISDSGYAGRGERGNPFYRGELTEFDVLGIDPARHVTDAEIAQALAHHQRLRLSKGATVMVIQSGALIPDDGMVGALDRDFSVVPFSGVPLAARTRPPYAQASASAMAVQNERDYAGALRLAAAKSGADAIICYWGVLESAVEGQVTKAVSWIPLIGGVIPDETQLMRIRLKVAIVDVRTGQWSMFAPAPYMDDSLSASLNRAASDQGQVALLKAKAYRAAVTALVARYAD